MASTIIAMTMMNTKCFNTTTSPKLHNPTKLITKPTSLLSLKNLLPKATPSTENTKLSSSIAGTALAGAIFSTLGACDPAFAAQQIADIAEASSDNRGLALLLPIIPAIAWVLFNILQPALNQINRMRNKGVIIGLGLGGLTASGFVSTQDAMASEIAAIAEAGSDNRGQLLLFVVAPAILWVLYNILQPALNQINRMRSD
ncbi:photosystem II core complex proteins psbY, chloroplastic [Vicia villosa]|uniref:photosystem II core complex proteins psbY, chloroplastic n=1 Tax=Vicia villosa TaxID=3911 RepID=UPI00273A970A|nr:photosystem II core complex proteins psbY, chloroplastic [Vicia villosa]